MSLRPFHLAFPVDDLAAARAFYGGVLGCREGRSSDEWIDFDFHGHQIVAHLAPDGGGGAESADRAANPVDGHEEIGRAHVCTPVTNAHLVCRRLLEKKNQNKR